MKASTAYPFFAAGMAILARAPGCFEFLTETIDSPYFLQSLIPISIALNPAM